MDISLDNAQRIVSEISSVLGADVNLIDQGAVIIASTDPARVGQHHQGAARIIADQLDRLIITDPDMPGVRPGLNLPIWADGEITGVLGITGDPATFTTPAHVLQKMTEILLRETRSRETAERHTRSYTRFLESWLSGARELSPSLIAEGRDFGIDVSAQYLVVTAQAVARSDHPRQLDIDRVTETVVHAARSRGAITAQIASRIVILFPLDRESTNGLTPTVEWLDRLARRVRASSNLRLAAGVSCLGVSAPEAAEQSMRALRRALHSTIDVQRYDEVTVDVLLSAIPQRERHAFTTRIFSGIPPQVRGELLKSLRAYFDADGSLTRAAEVLHVHKNTLSGRLHRIAETTGLDPRSTGDAAVLWLALQLD